MTSSSAPRDRPTSTTWLSTHGHDADRETKGPVLALRLESLAKRFERDGIRWCSLDAGSQHWPGPDGGEASVLVEPQDLGRAEEAVRAAGGIVAASADHDDLRTWLLPDPASGSNVTLRVATRVGSEFGETASRHLLQGVLVNRVADPVPRVAATELFWLRLLPTLRRRHPASAELPVLRALHRRVPVATSPLAEVITKCLQGEPTVSSLLAALEHHDVLPRIKRRYLRLPRHGRRRSGRAFRRQARLGLTIAVIDAEGATRPPLLTGTPDWLFPVLVVDASALADEDVPSSARLVTGPLRLEPDLGRCTMTATDTADAAQFADESGLVPSELLDYDEVKALGLDDVDCWHIWTYGDLSDAQLAKLHRLHSSGHHDTLAPQEG